MEWDTVGAVQNNRPENSPVGPEETSSLERVDETSTTSTPSPSTPAGESGGRADSPAPQAGSAPNVAPEAEEAALDESARSGTAAHPGAEADPATAADPAAGAASGVPETPAEAGPESGAPSTGERADSPRSTDSADGAASEEDGSSLERDGDEVIYVRRSAIRRRPKYGRFVGLGVLLGAILAVTLGQIGEVAGDSSGIGYSRTDLVLVLALTLVPLGAIVGGVVAMIFDRRNR